MWRIQLQQELRAVLVGMMCDQLGPTDHTSAPHLFGISAPVYPQLLLSQYHGDIEVLIWLLFYLKKKLFGVKLKVWQVQENPDHLILGGHCPSLSLSLIFSPQNRKIISPLSQDSLFFL